MSHTAERMKYIGLFIAPLGLSIIPFMLVLFKDDEGYRDENCHNFAVQQALAEEQEREQVVIESVPDDSPQADVQYRENPFQVGTETFENFQEQVYTDVQEGPTYSETESTSEYDAFVYEQHYNDCLAR